MIGRLLISRSSRRFLRQSSSSYSLPRSKVTRNPPLPPPLQLLYSCHNNVRWLATKRQERSAAAEATAAASSSSSPQGSSSPPNSKTSRNHDEQPIGNDATSDQKSSSPAVLWLPPPLANTKDLQEAFDSFSSSSTTTTTSSSASLFEFHDHYKHMYNKDMHLASAPQDWIASGYEAATPLWEDFAALIGVSGRPISVADYMRLCLTHPVHGYYTRANNNASRGSVGVGGAAVGGGSRKHLEDDFDYDEWDDTKNSSNSKDGLIIGPSGDFVTAPEMTQIFGECIAVWFMTVWQQKQQQTTTAATTTATTTDKGGDDASWQWLEFGPGTGALMADLIRFCFYTSEKIRNTFGGSNCRAIHFIEQSPRLRQVQKETLESVHQHAIPAAVAAPGGGEVGIAKKQRFFEFEFHDDNEHNNNSNNNKDQAASRETNNGNDSDIVHRLPVYWHESLAHFTAWQAKNQSYLPTYAVCQEFLDALPIYAFEKTAKEGWRERLVDIALREDMMESMMDDDEKVDSSSTSKTQQQEQQQQSQDSTAAATRLSAMKKPRLRIVLAPEVTPAARTLLGVQEIKDGDGSVIVLLPGEGDPQAPAGSVIEVNPEAILLVQDLARLIDRQGGAAIIIDYGPERGSRDSIRAFSRHEQVHFLSQPGLVDITADVDFAALKHAVNHLHDSPTTRNGNSDKKSASTTTTTRAFGPVTQGNFLMAMGANDRAIQLIENDNTTEEEAENIYQALVRLCSPEDMGQRFKVMALLDPSTFENSNSDSGSMQQPPGF
jgi:NADH dehydrogenase [ubiquinone] 1 alpha subcomplex assembly factor 7